MPVRKNAKISAIITRVIEAFLDFGSLKLGTAFEIASTPVKDDEPLEKAFKNNSTEALPVATCPVVVG